MVLRWLQRVRMFEESLTLLSSLLGSCGGLGEVDVYIQLANALLS